MAYYTPSLLLDDYSLEITAKDSPSLLDAASLIRQGTRINVTFLGNEDVTMRLAATHAIDHLKFVPVPHIAARRLGSGADLENFLSGLKEQSSDRLFIVGGDPDKPEGPFEDALDIVSSGLLQRFGAKEVSIAGYPGGHPKISDESLWDSLLRKHEILEKNGTMGSITTQFDFDVDPVVKWIEKVRAANIRNQAPSGIRVTLRRGIKRRDRKKVRAIAHESDGHCGSRQIHHDPRPET